MELALNVFLVVLAVIGGGAAGLVLAVLILYYSWKLIEHFKI